MEIDTIDFGFDAWEAEYAADPWWKVVLVTLFVLDMMLAAALRGEK